MIDQGDQSPSSGVLLKEHFQLFIFLMIKAFMTSLFKKGYVEVLSMYTFNYVLAITFRIIRPTLICTDGQYIARISHTVWLSSCINLRPYK
jgi:hypothetical protein